MGKRGASKETKTIEKATVECRVTHREFNTLIKAFGVAVSCIMVLAPALIFPLQVAAANEPEFIVLDAVRYTALESQRASYSSNWSTRVSVWYDIEMQNIGGDAGIVEVYQGGGGTSGIGYHLGWPSGEVRWLRFGTAISAFEPSSEIVWLTFKSGTLEQTLYLHFDTFLSLNCTPSMITKEHQGNILISGRLSDMAMPDTTAGIPGQNISLLYAEQGVSAISLPSGNWTSIATVTTDPSGYFSYEWNPPRCDWPPGTQNPYAVIAKWVEGTYDPDTGICPHTMAAYNLADPTIWEMYWDYDHDGLSDYEEVVTFGTEMNVPDTDGDGLSDGVEIRVFQTDPLKWDTDGDGISDGLEVVAAGLLASTELLPEGWIRVKLFWSDYTISIETSSAVLGVTFDSDNKQLSVNVGGTDGTEGACNITIPKALVSSASDVKVYLDGEPIEFTLNGDMTYYYVHVEYHHSLRRLVTNFAPGLCFIATAAYGTPMAKEIQVLREFRDEYLLTNPVGQAFVDFYYKVSPPIADFITDHPSLKPIVRGALLPAVAMSTMVVNTTPVEKVLIIGLVLLVSVALAVRAIRRRLRGLEHT
jgi:hypothetical protein